MTAFSDKNGSSSCQNTVQIQFVEKDLLRVFLNIESLKTK